MTVQKVRWGRIEWLHTRDERESGQSMSVGIVVIEPGERQDSHVHYGEEQFIYMVSGTGEHTVDGETHVLGPGCGMYLKPGVTHEMENRSAEPIFELLVSNPVSCADPLQMDGLQIGSGPREGLSFFAGPEGTQAGQEADGVDLAAAVEAVTGQLAGAFSAPFAIFDTEWNMLLQNSRYPAYCHRTCMPSGKGKAAPCLSAGVSSSRPGGEVRWFVCPYGLVVYELPLEYRGEALGSIRGGHIVQTALSGDIRIPDMYDTPHSTAIGIQSLLRQIAKSLLAYCDFANARGEIRRKNELLASTETRSKGLERDLRLSEDKVTGLLINRHFLFNTLNSMADMALQKRGESLYGAIISLANMFRYTSQKNRPFVRLEQELAYVDNYLALQKLRHGEKLAVRTDVSEGLRDCYVPMDFMQPVMENAFVHGFRNITGSMEIFLVVERRGDSCLRIVIANNGDAPAGEELEQINRAMTGGEGDGHGLSLIFTKLKILYGDAFSMCMATDAAGRVTVTMELPLRYEEFFHD